MSDSTSADSPHDVIASVMAQFDISPTHSDECIAEAHAWIENPGLNDKTLIDWRALPFVTIDNPDSRDLDQALLIERIDTAAGNRFRFRYALADAAYYVRPGSALFNEALQRGSSYYFPTLAAPMLPIELSEGLVSLNPNVERRALVFDIVVSAEGHVVKTDVVRALIKSAAKLNYAGVQLFLDAMDRGSGHGYLHTPFADSLIALKELGELLIAQAEDRDVIAYDRVESSITVTGEPPEFTLGERKRYATERYNEQLSLLCNMEGAALFTALLPQSEKLQAIFRVHEAPLKQAHKELRNSLSAIVEEKKLEAHWAWNKEQSLAEYVAALPRNQTTNRLAMAIERQILMTNRASEFSAEPGRHYALRAPSYARFSSPMREIVGIFTHKELLDALGNPDAEHHEDELLQSAIIDAGNRAKQTQKMLDKAIELAVIHRMLHSDLKQSKPPRYHGTVMGARGDRLYIAVDEFAMDLKVYRQDLQKQYDTTYTFDGMSAKAAEDHAPRFLLGDAVELKVKHYDAERRRYELLVWKEDSQP